MTRRRKSNTSRQGQPAAGDRKPADKPKASEPSPQSTPPKGMQRQWYKADLHTHTMASKDYEQPSATYLDYMRRAVEQGLDVVAITDHNTVAGVGAIRREIEWLTRLEKDDRLTEEEKARLAEWRELSEKVLVLPGFEFTATFGFHILGIFPPETSVRHLEHILLMLKVPAEKLDEGSTETGASTDVLTAYRVIREAGGLAIAAHANSTHGVAMRDFPFGGQTKIAYTQDVNLDALEVTDLEKRGRSTARFFNGVKAEYPRRMHCIQGSDAHRLIADPKNPKRLGLGDRATELLLEAPSFEAIANMLRSESFERTRPARPKDKPFDAVAAAREEGPSITQSFYESATQRGGRLTAILSDVCAFANTIGGTVYVGASYRKGPPTGLKNPQQVLDEIKNALSERITPPLECKMDIRQSEGVQVVRMQVPKGGERPYCLDEFKFYIRDEAETNLAVRDEIVALVSEVLAEKHGGGQSSKAARQRDDSRQRGKPVQHTPTSEPAKANGAATDDAFYLPQVGVEIIETEQRNGHQVHSIRDMRNGHVIKNVTRRGSRKLWNYAIQRHEDHPVDEKKVQWQGDVGLVSVDKRAGKTRYDLALREKEQIRVFYGVTEDGMEGRWAAFLQDEE
ncbi:MAG: putative DNA binding domain-containing protein [Caldilineaceae bacterium]